MGLTNEYSFNSIRVLDFLNGFPYDDIAEAYITALRPSMVRVSEGMMQCSSCLWRVSVFIDPVTKKIIEITQEVRVQLPDGIQDGHELSNALLVRNNPHIYSSHSQDTYTDGDA